MREKKFTDNPVHRARMKLIWDKIRNYRTEVLGMTWAELAKGLGTTHGVIRVQSSTNESISLDRLYGIADVFRCEVHELLPTRTEIIREFRNAKRRKARR